LSAVRNDTLTTMATMPTTTPATPASVSIVFMMSLRFGCAATFRQIAHDSNATADRIAVSASNPPPDTVGLFATLSSRPIGLPVTDLNWNTGCLTPEQGAVVVATLPEDGPTGGFFTADGSQPW
jgi:hypothetical protein